MGTLGAIFSSFDGENWSRVTVPGEFSDITNVDSVVYTGSRWIAFGRVHTASNAAIITADLTNFDRIAQPNVQEVFCSALGNSIVIGSGFLGFLVSPDEGQTWQEIGYSNPSYQTPPLAFGNGIFLAAQSIAHNSGTITVQQSADGLTWNDVGSIHLSVLGNLMFVNGLFYMMGNDDSGHPAIWSSPTGVTWTYIPISNTPFADSAFFCAMAFGNGIYVLIPNTQNVACYTSTDGINFSTNANMPLATGLYVKMTFADGVFVAVTQQPFFVLSLGTIAFTTDGTDWQTTVATNSDNASLFDIVART